MWKDNLLSIIPVTLIDFKGTLHNKTVLLQWSTSTENNSQHFELEKSFNGINFLKIAKVPAAGFSNTLKQYSHVDSEPLTEKNYYLLKSVDRDGNERLISKVVFIKLPDAQQVILVMGNPFKKDIIVRFVKPHGGSGEMILTDIAGRFVARQAFEKYDQHVQFKVPSVGLASGMYLLKAICNGQEFVVKVVKE